MTSVDPLPRLAASISAISTQLNSISAELRSLQAVSAPPQYAPQYPPQPYPWQSYWQPHPIAAPPRRPQHVPPPRPADPRPTLWERLSREGAGSRLIAWVGMLLLLVLAVQRGYLGPVPRLLLGVALAVALVGIAVRVHRIPDAAAGAQALAATGLAVGYLDTGVSGAILSLGLAVSPDNHGFLVGHMLVTLSSTVGALVLLLRHLDSVPLRVAGLALVGAALAKLLLFDLASLSGLPRVLAFLGAGLVLLAAGARYARLVSARRP